MTLLCFGTYFIKLFFSSEAILPWFATSSVIITVFLPYVLGKIFHQIPKKVLTVLKSIICFGMIFFIITFSMLIIYIFSDSGEYIPSQTSDSVFIVFGSKINKTGPTKVLAARLDCAIEAMKIEEKSICILTGGQGIDENMPESECMKEYMIQNGISEDRIICEKEASDTIHNIQNSKMILESNNLTQKNIVCISSNTHIPRIKLICDKENMCASYLKAPSPIKISTFTSLVREYLSYIKLLIVYK